VCERLRERYIPRLFDAIGIPIPSNWNPGNSPYTVLLLFFNRIRWQIKIGYYRII